MNGLRRAVRGGLIGMLWLVWALTAKAQDAGVAEEWMEPSPASEAEATDTDARESPPAAPAPEPAPPPPPPESSPPAAPSAPPPPAAVPSGAPAGWPAPVFAPGAPAAPSAALADDAVRPGRLRLAAQTEAALGISGSGFYNHLLGARLDFFFSDSVSLGGYLGYANLKGREGREHNVLPYLMLEHRVRLTRDGGIRLPLRFANGYLPANGPFLRLSAGLSFALDDDTILGLDLIVPTLWLSGNRTAVSFDLAAEGAWML